MLRVSRLNKYKRPILCYVTDRSALPPSPSATSDVLGKIAEAQSAGVDWIQIREKDLSARELAALLDEALKISSASKILVNDRLDVALAGSASGVHLTETSVSARDARKLASSLSGPPGFLVGVSCHSLDGARAAADSGADYLVFGPVFPTPSKAAYGAPQGLERLAEVCRTVDIPVLAIGGIDLENAASCLAVGASGIAAIRLFQDAADLPVTVRALHALPLR